MKGQSLTPILRARMMFMALMGQNMCRDQGFIADSMLCSGFKSVRSRTMVTSMVPMDLDIGRNAK